MKQMAKEKTVMEIFLVARMHVQKQNQTGLERAPFREAQEHFRKNPQTDLLHPPLHFPNRKSLTQLCHFP